MLASANAAPWHVLSAVFEINLLIWGERDTLTSKHPMEVGRIQPQPHTQRMGVQVGMNDGHTMIGSADPRKKSCCL